MPIDFNIFSMAATIGPGPHITATVSNGLTFISFISSVTKPTRPRQSGVGASTVKRTFTDFCQRSVMSLIKISSGLVAP